jgi:hypothetical protein
LRRYSSRKATTCVSSVSAAAAPSWRNVHAPESTFVFTLRKSETSRASPATQPTRQPVMALRFDMEKNERMPSLRSSRGEGGASFVNQISE